MSHRHVPDHFRRRIGNGYERTRWIPVALTVFLGLVPGSFPQTWSHNGPQAWANKAVGIMPTAEVRDEYILLRDEIRRDDIGTGAEKPRMVLFAQPNASDPPQLKTRDPLDKPSYDELTKTQHDEHALIKFSEGTGVRLRDSHFVVVEDDLELNRAARRGVSRSVVDVQLAALNDLLRRYGAAIQRLVSSTSETRLSEQRRQGEMRSAKELADLNLFYELRFSGREAADVASILHELNQFEVVEFAAPTIKVAPPPTDIPPSTPDLTINQQGYFAAAPNGIDVNYARQLPGGRGETLRVVVVESGWTADHEDFPTLVSSSGISYSAPGFRDHGAATIGEIAALENTYGMTGIAPSVEISVASPVVPPNDAYNLPDAIQRAIDQSRAGDVILVEQQVYYNYPADQSFCPPEWDVGTYSVIETAAANGRIVILTAGNGYQNLDDHVRFNSRFDRNVMDSGSIYVGAGGSGNRVPLPFSNHGSRLDFHGWGENIGTLGYGTQPCGWPCLFFPDNDDRQSYTAGFGGTSGAAPFVTGAAALIQSIRRARALPDFNSQEMRTHLQTGATPQGGGVIIGPLPDLRDAIVAIPVPVPTITATGAGNGSATITWNAVSGVIGYDVFRRDSQAGSWSLVGTTGSTQFVDPGLVIGAAYLYRVRAYDAAGNRSADSNADLATMMDFTDHQLSTLTPIRAKHIIEARTAANAICAFAGPTTCASPPFSGTALDENHLTTESIKAGDFTGLQNHFITLRAAIGASAAIFRETPAVGAAVKAIHMEDLRTACN
jgi:serine protease